MHFFPRDTSPHPPKDIDGITLMDKIVEVCCDLNNVCDTVIPFD